MSDPDFALLSSPIEQRSIGRLFVIGGPIGLAIAMMLSLWVSQHHVTDSVIVQVEPRWVPDEQLALRVQVTPESVEPIESMSVELWVEQGGQRYPLPPPSAVATISSRQGRFRVPSLTLGPAVLHVHVEAEPFEPRTESISIEVVRERAPIEAQPVVSTSAMQYVDDSDAQSEGWAVDLRPVGRVLAGFENTLMLRVIESSASPWSGPVELHLLEGEWAGQRGTSSDPPMLWSGRTDAAGLATLQGQLSSEIIRIRVSLRASTEPSGVLHTRAIRLVSFAGAVDLKVEPLRLTPTGTVDVLAAGLSGMRPVFVDMFGPDGAWIDTLDPPVQGREPPRPWSMPRSQEGLVQFEAYHFTTAPGESTAVARIYAGPDEGTGPDRFVPLLEAQRQRLSVPRVDRTWDEGRERAYLRMLGQGAWSADVAANVTRWLLGTLPIEVRGPPTVLRSHERDVRAMAEYRRRWILGLRWFLLGGGALFLISMAGLMIHSHNRDASATLSELGPLNEPVERDRVAAGVRRSRWVGIGRGLAAIIMMGVALVCAVLLLEKLVWKL